MKHEQQPQINHPANSQTSPQSALERAYENDPVLRNLLQDLTIARQEIGKLRTTGEGRKLTGPEASRYTYLITQEKTLELLIDGQKQKIRDEFVARNDDKYNVGGNLANENVNVENGVWNGVGNGFDRSANDRRAQ